MVSVSCKLQPSTNSYVSLTGAMYVEHRIKLGDILDKKACDQTLWRTDADREQCISMGPENVPSCHNSADSRIPGHGNLPERGTGFKESVDRSAGWSQGLSLSPFLSGKHQVWLSF